MLPSIDRRHFLQLSFGTALIGYGGGAIGKPARDPGPVPARNIIHALASLDGLVAAQMARSGMPGMAVAVVQGDRIVYARGFGTRRLGSDAPVDADTVFQLASVSKSLAGSVVAHEVGAGHVGWNTTIRSQLPWFALANADTTARVTIADMLSHRSGLHDHAGDQLEDMGYDQRAVLERLRYAPLAPLRKEYAYTNFGFTAGGLAAAVPSGLDWATLSQQVLYGPLGMTRSSSRFADFMARDNRVTGHRQVAGHWEIGPVRMPDAQAPAASVTSSVNDMAQWLSMMLGVGRYQGRRVVDAQALTAAISPQMPTGGNHHYGYGFNTGRTAANRITYSHSGAFALGTGAGFKVIPSTGIGIVALANGAADGSCEIVMAQFLDLVEQGAIEHDYAAMIVPYFVKLNAPEGALVGVARPANPAPASRPLAALAGTYRNDYYGPARVAVSGNALVLTLGPTPLVLPLMHWDGDVFTFMPDTENAPPGTVSKATFAAGSLNLETYDDDHLGTFTL